MTEGQVLSGHLARIVALRKHRIVEPLPRDSTIIMLTLGRMEEKLDEILAILRNDEEEAEDQTDA